MRMTYYEATGETRDKLREAMDDRNAAFKKLHAWAKRNGGQLATSESTWGLSVVLSCDRPKEPEHWKIRRREQPGFWTPKHSTKRGKELITEVAKLTAGANTKQRIADVIGLPFIEAAGFVTPDVGIAECGKRILIAVRSNSFKPSKTVSLKRISDVEYEAAQKGKVSP